MEVFDYIIMAVGALLIVIGLALFASGKRESANSNQVEGFGIKLNVSNPSIILIVLGIGLLLAPRLLPKDSSDGAPSTAQTTANQEPGTSPPTATDAAAQRQAATTESVTRPPASAPVAAAGQQQAAATIPPATQTIAAPTMFMPAGAWRLVDYEEDGVDLSGNVQGTIYFERQSAAQVAWTADFVLADGWGNMANYRYTGLIGGSNGAHSIAVTASNAPNFYTEGATPLNLWIEDGGRLHMEYSHNGSDILIHWSQ